MVRTRGPRDRFSLGILAPLLLVVGLFTDVASRFLSYDLVSFRAWEAVGRFGWTGLGGPFEPDRSYASDRTYGDLSSVGNLPELRQYRTEVFTTDSYGFRNSTGPSGAPFVGVLFGSSFAIGASLKDEDTLSSQLGEILGKRVYNAGGTSIEDEKAVSKIIQRLGIRNGVLIHEYVESTLPPGVTSAHSARRSLAEGIADRFGDRFRSPMIWSGRVRGWLASSPLELALFKAFKRIEDDRILPNPFAASVVRDQLSNGDPILFNRAQATPEAPPIPATVAVARWTQLAERTRARGLELLVVLVPDQFAVYGPLTKQPRSDRQLSYLSELEQGLRASGVPVVNLTETFRARAREGMPKGDYIYWRDDTHWNASGVALAAREIASALGSLRVIRQ